jgi:hypothetical protein
LVLVVAVVQQLEHKVQMELILYLTLLHQMAVVVADHMQILVLEQVVLEDQAAVEQLLNQV